MFGDGQRRQQTQPGLCGKHQQALFAAGSQHIRSLHIKEFDTHHQADAGNVLDVGQLCQAGAQLYGALADLCKEALVQTVYHHICTGAYHRVAAKGRAVGAGAHALGYLFIHQHRADGQTAAQSLGKGDDIRLEVIVLTA